MQKKEIKKVYIQKIKELRKHDKAYFKHDKPIISDKDYDIIKNEVLGLEQKYKYLKNRNSPSKKVGYEPSSRFRKVDWQQEITHAQNMLEQAWTHAWKQAWTHAWNMLDTCLEHVGTSLEHVGTSSFLQMLSMLHPPVVLGQAWDGLGQG